MNFSIRSSESETMDDLQCSGPILNQTLRELEFINKWLGGNNVTTNALNLFSFQSLPDTKFTIADLGCGGGDMLRLINRWAKRKNLNVELIGIDANPNIIKYAINSAAPSNNISFYALDIFSDEFRKLKFDIVIGTLFFHHFSEAELIRFFTDLRKQVSLGIIINDIHRHFLAYYSIQWLTKLFSKSSMVKNDAPLSVRKAFSRAELENILIKAGYSNFQIKWKWAFRWQVIVLQG
jgi:2-polyprenyl-3-methyl-5-hydroxy-6-metoxy-1,4-benzoquinol methylase